MDLPKPPGHEGEVEEEPDDDDVGHGTAAI